MRWARRKSERRIMDALILMRTKLAASYVNGTLDYQEKTRLTFLTEPKVGIKKKKKCW